MLMQVPTMYGEIPVAGWSYEWPPQTGSQLGCLRRPKEANKVAKERKEKKALAVLAELNDLMTGKEDGDVWRQSPSYRPEYGGTYDVAGKKGRKAVDRIHGRIVNQLAEDLAARGVQAYNSGVMRRIRPDMVIIAPWPTIIEVKTKSTWVDVKDAIGQLYSYSTQMGGHENVTKVAIMPHRIVKEKIDVLEAVGIQVVKWRENRNGFSFMGATKSILKQDRLRTKLENRLRGPRSDDIHE